ncbi:MAG: hypothetical protein AAF577_12480 [Pseudomonadota bacterium]
MADELGSAKRSKIGAVFTVPLASDGAYAVGLIRYDDQDGICLAYFLDQRFPEIPLFRGVRDASFADGIAYRQWCQWVGRRWKRLGKIDAQKAIPSPHTRFAAPIRYEGTLRYDVVTRRGGLNFDRSGWLAEPPEDWETMPRWGASFEEQHETILDKDIGRGR